MKVFWSDIATPCVKTRQCGVAMSLTRTGKLFKLTIARPLTLTPASTDCLLFNTDALSNKGKRIIRIILKQNARIQVVVVDKKSGTMFNRGIFAVLHTLRAGRFVLQRQREHQEQIKPLFLKTIGTASLSIETTNNLHGAVVNRSTHVTEQGYKNATTADTGTDAPVETNANVIQPQTKIAYITPPFETMVSESANVPAVSVATALPASTAAGGARSIAPVKHGARASRILSAATLARFMDLYSGDVQVHGEAWHMLKFLLMVCGEEPDVSHFSFKRILTRLPLVRLCHSDIITSVQSPDFKLVSLQLGISVKCCALQEWAVAHRELTAVLAAYGLYTQRKKVRDGQTFFNVYFLAVMPYMQMYLENHLSIDTTGQQNIVLVDAMCDTRASLCDSSNFKQSTINSVLPETSNTTTANTIEPAVRGGYLCFFETTAPVITPLHKPPAVANRRRREWLKRVNPPQLVSAVVQNDVVRSSSRDHLKAFNGCISTTTPNIMSATTTTSSTAPHAFPSHEPVLCASMCVENSPVASVAPVAGHQCHLLPVAPVAPFAHVPSNQLTTPAESLYGKSHTLSYANNTQRCTPTVFNGTQFRSRLEARCADLMTRMNVPYLFESIKMKLSNGSWYTPDFWLPSQKIAIEIKPCYPHLEEISKCESVSRSGLFITLMYGNPALVPYGSEIGGRNYAHSTGLRGISWENGSRLAGDTVWLEDNGVIGLGQITESSDMRWNAPSIVTAIKMVPLH